jgi:hypothetical protein
LNTFDQPTLGRKTVGELDARSSVANELRDPPWYEGLNVDHSLRSIAKHGIDRKAHTEGVDLTTRFQHERFPCLQTFAPPQSPETQIERVPITHAIGD